MNAGWTRHVTVQGGLVPDQTQLVASAVPGMCTVTSSPLPCLSSTVPGGRGADDVAELAAERVHPRDSAFSCDGGQRLLRLVGIVPGRRDAHLLDGREVSPDQ